MHTCVHKNIYLKIHTDIYYAIRLLLWLEIHSYGGIVLFLKVADNRDLLHLLPKGKEISIIWSFINAAVLQ